MTDIARGSGEARPISIGEPEKVTAWPFKEPEKKTAWKDDERAGPPKDAPGARFMVDTQAEKDARRTEEIKAQMSPPGALKLPPLLEEARWKWGIPDGAFASQAVLDRIHVFPIDFEGKQDTYGNTGIVKPEVTQLRDKQNGHRGVLISMGLEAMDHLISHGVELGHVILTIRNAPHAQECARLTTGSMFFLVMRDGDLTSDETLRQQLLSGERKIIDAGPDNGYCFELEGSKKRKALINDQW